MDEMITLFTYDDQDFLQHVKTGSPDDIYTFLVSVSEPSAYHVGDNRLIDEIGTNGCNADEWIDYQEMKWKEEAIAS